MLEKMSSIVIRFTISRKPSNNTLASVQHKTYAYSNIRGEMNKQSEGDEKRNDELVDKGNFSSCAGRSTPLTEFERVKLYRYRRGSGDKRERVPRGRGFLLTPGANSLCSNYHGSASPTTRACPPTRFDLFRFRLTARYSRLFFSPATQFLLALR